MPELKEGEKSFAIKKADLSRIFGSLEFKESAQQIKDEIRKGWK